MPAPPVPNVNSVPHLHQLWLLVILGKGRKTRNCGERKNEEAEKKQHIPRAHQLPHAGQRPPHSSSVQLGLAGQERTD